MTTKETIKTEVEEMPAFEVFLVQLRSQFDIVSEMSKHLKLKKVGDHYICACPVHRDKADSCRVSPDTQGFFSFDCCGAGGDIIEFERCTNCDVNYTDAVVLLAEKAGLDIPKELEQV